MEDFGFLVFVLSSSLLLVLGFWSLFRDKTVYKVPKVFPLAWRTLLESHVHFYQNLTPQQKKHYEEQIRSFFKQVRITGIQVEVSDLDRLLAASSAIIPLFNFPNWTFNHLYEILIYPTYFDSNFSLDNPKEVISGMVGTGRNMDGIMILNRDSLHNGFKNSTDKKNVGIHEMAHILDKQDGIIDGVSGALNNAEYLKPWISLMHKKMQDIKDGQSDINEYAATSEEEFLAVTTEYFFERPKLLKSKHPRLYEYLKKVYQVDMIKRLTIPFRKKRRVGRNDPCPCGSGEKFKKCCF